MGHFVFSLEKGEVPLTNRDLPTPGPAEYSPDYTKCSVYAKAPEYSSRLWTKPCKYTMLISVKLLSVGSRTLCPW